MEYDIATPEDLERVIRELELVKDGKTIPKERLEELRELKSGAIMAWDLLKRDRSPINISGRSHYMIGLIEEILYRANGSTVQHEVANLLSAASAYQNAGRRDLAIPLLGECIERYPKLAAYAQKMKDKLASEQ